MTDMSSLWTDRSVRLQRCSRDNTPSMRPFVQTSDRGACMFCLHLRQSVAALDHNVCPRIATIVEVHVMIYDTCVMRLKIPISRPPAQLTECLRLSKQVELPTLMLLHYTAHKHPCLAVKPILAFKYGFYDTHVKDMHEPIRSIGGVGVIVRVGVTRCFRGAAAAGAAMFCFMGVFLLAECSGSCTKPAEAHC